MVNRLEEELALSIMKIEKDIQELGRDNQVEETVRGIISIMKKDPRIK